MDSILYQKVSFDYEIIVINDGSTDNTAQLLEKYKQYKHVVVIDQNNKGLSAARNRGIDSAKGEYICFVDSDDELAEDALECLAKEVMRNHPKMVATSVEKKLRCGTSLYKTQLKTKKLENESLPGYACGKLIHYSVFNNLRFPEGYWYEDSVMAQIVHPMCKDSTYTISDVCYIYYSNESGLTALSRGNKKSLDSLWITMRLLKERKQFGLDYNQDSYEYFLSMVALTYQRTKFLGEKIAKCVFVTQRMLLMKYYKGYQTVSTHKKIRIQEALINNDFKKYILACEKKK